MGDADRSTPRNADALENIARWKRAMDGIATTLVETEIKPGEALFVLAKCLGHALQEVPDPGEREQLLRNLVNIIRRIMQNTEESGRDTFIWR